MFEPTISWDPSNILRTADYYEQIEDSLVIVAKVTATNIASMTATDSVRITLKKQVCALVQFAEAGLSPGDTTLLTFKKLTGTGLEDFPAGQLFDIFIVNQSNNGVLLSSGGTTGDMLLGVPVPVYYIAPDSLTGDSLVVGIRAETSAQTQASVLRVSSSTAGLSVKRAADGSRETGADAALRAYAQLLYALAEEFCPLPSKVVVKAKNIILTVTSNLSEVRPKTTGGQNSALITVKAFKEGQPGVGVPVQLKIEPISMSGGHDHPHVNRPKGVLSATAGITDAQGKLSPIQYEAPIIGGEEEIIVSSPQAQSNAKVKIVVRVGGLEPLPISPLYELVGAPNNHAGTNDPCRTIPPASQHSQNHYGTSILTSAIMSIAATYESLHSGIRLRVNDMSLASGGVFDYRNDWQTPHAEHKVGENADIGFKGINNSNLCEDIKRGRLLRSIETYTRGLVKTHDDHYHIRIK